MAFATATTDTKFVVPLRTFLFPHARRCLIENRGRIIEFASPVSVQYTHGIPFQILKILDDELKTKYINKSGWIFDGGELHDLWAARKLDIL